MVIKKSWEDFEREIIQTNRKFFIYGAGLIYEKIFPIVGNRVYGVFDRNAEVLKDKTILIKNPNELLKDKKNNVDILSCLNPFKDYQKRTDEIAFSLEIYDKEINLFYLDDKEIEETGVINWNGNELLINNLLFLVHEGWKRNFIREAYTDIQEFGFEYMKKLYDEPIDIVLYGNRIGLKNYDNGLIIHKNGRKETFYGKKIQDSKRIWLFGDSRVSGMLNSSANTFASFLQMRLSDSDEIYYEVLNCGIPGRDIERMFYQIQTEKIAVEDIVIVGTGFYEFEGNLMENILLWCKYIKMMADECSNKKAQFLYINLPTILEMNVKTSLEIEMLDFFNKTEFTNYKIEEIEYCKNIIRFICGKNGISFYDFSEAFNHRKEYGHVFINLHHYGPNGNKLIANKLYDILQIIEKVKQINEEKINKLKDKKDIDFKKKLNKLRDEDKELQNYICSIQVKLEDKKLDFGLIGSIVMNANPFTNGHLFLIKEALKSVDFLIVFVVSEDSSFFSFKQRFEMVSENLKYYEDVLVVPSGKYCISKQTFPDYFKKEDLQGKQTSALYDLEIFANRIAPKLKIKIRFVGEEPEDIITKQYNTQMKKVLPQYGVDVLEIPRKVLDDGTIISASRVRKSFEAKKLNEINKFVSRITLDLLEKYLESFDK